MVFRQFFMDISSAAHLRSSVMSITYSFYFSLHRYSGDITHTYRVDKADCLDTMSSLICSWCQIYRHSKNGVTILDGEEEYEMKEPNDKDSIKSTPI